MTLSGALSPERLQLRQHINTDRPQCSMNDITVTILSFDSVCAFFCGKCYHLTRNIKNLYFFKIKLNLKGIAVLLRLATQPHKTDPCKYCIETNGPETETHIQ